MRFSRANNYRGCSRISSFEYHEFTIEIINDLWNECYFADVFKGDICFTEEYVSEIRDPSPFYAQKLACALADKIRLNWDADIIQSWLKI